MSDQEAVEVERNDEIREMLGRYFRRRAMTGSLLVRDMSPSDARLLADWVTATFGRPCEHGDRIEPCGSCPVPGIRAYKVPLKNCNRPYTCVEC